MTNIKFSALVMLGALFLSCVSVDQILAKKANINPIKAPCWDPPDDY